MVCLMFSISPDRRTAAAQPTTGPSEPLRALRGDLPAALLAILMFAMPLYRTGVLEDSFNPPKLALAMMVGVLAAIAILVRPQAFRLPLRWYSAPWMLITFCVWQAVSTLWAESKPLAVDGTVYFATFAVLCWLFTRGPASSAALKGMFHFGAAAAVVTAGWVLLDDFVGGEPGMVARLPDWRGLLAAGLGNSGHIAGMVGMFLPWLLLTYLRRDLRRGGWACLLGILVSFAALTVTWSVGSAGATIISLGIWGIVGALMLPRGLLRWRRLVWVIAAGLAVVAFYFTPSPANPHSPSILKQAFSSQRWEDGWPTRVAIWETTWHMIKQDPLLGGGTGNFTYLYPQQIVPYLRNDPKLAQYAGQFTNDAHNDYLQVWAEGGIVALALWVGVLSAFFIQVVRMLGRERRLEDADRASMLIGAGAGMTVFALDGLMSFPMRLPAHFAMAMFFVAVPGVLLRLAAAGRVRPGSLGGQIAARGNRWRAGGVGVLLTLAACCWHHGHRVVAEYYLKAGRNLAGSSVVNTGQGIQPTWATCDLLYRRLIAALAAGAPVDALAGDLEQMQMLASTEEMDQARELFEKSLAADRWYANASSRLGQLLLFQNKWPESLAVSRKTLRTLETYEVHERVAMAAFFLGDMKLSHEHWVICNTRVSSFMYYSELVQRTAEK
jgi:O-antigen ligase